MVGDIVKKKITIGIIIFLGLIGIGITTYFFTNLSDAKKQQERQTNVDTIVNKDTKIELITELSFEINSELNIGLLISKDNQLKIINKEEEIDTSVLGEKEITIKYIDAEGEEQEEKVKIKIIDTIAPEIKCEKELSTIANKEIDLLNNVKVTDNSNEEIKVLIEGDYDLKKEGVYKLKYVAKDSSENITNEEFTLKVTTQATQINQTTQTITNSNSTSDDTKNNDKSITNKDNESNTNTSNKDNNSINANTNFNDNITNIEFPEDLQLEPPLTCDKENISEEEFTNIVPEFTLTEVSGGFDFQIKLPPSVGGKPVHKKSCLGLYIKMPFMNDKAYQVVDSGGVYKSKIPYGLFKEGKNTIKIALYSYNEKGKEVYSKFAEKTIDVHLFNK